MRSARMIELIEKHLVEGWFWRQSCRLGGNQHAANKAETPPDTCCSDKDDGVESRIQTICFVNIEHVCRLHSSTSYVYNFANQVFKKGLGGAELSRIHSSISNHFTSIIITVSYIVPLMNQTVIREGIY